MVPVGDRSLDVGAAGHRSQRGIEENGSAPERPKRRPIGRMRGNGPVGILSGSGRTVEVRCHTEVIGDLEQ